MDLINNFVDTILNIIGNFGYLGIFLAVYLEYACFPLPSEVILPFVGLLAATGNVTFIGALTVSVIAGILGSITCYYIGYFGGSILLDKIQEKFKGSRKSIEKINHLINKYQKTSIFFTRLLPLTRTYISLVVGSIKLNLSHFLLYSLGGIFIWNTFLISIGYFLGENKELINKILGEYSIVAIGLVLIIIIVFLVKKFYKKKERV